MIRVVLVTGFLGTGKTTLINRALAGRNTARTGIIVNEAGDTAFDGALIAQASGDGSSLRMLGNGCLCCQASDDLAEAIRMMAHAHRTQTGHWSETIIVEASGLAQPGRLLRQLQAIDDLPIATRVIATVDATLAANPERHPEIAAQWASANTLVLTKVDAGTAGAAVARASAVNPLANWGKIAAAADAIFGGSEPLLNTAPCANRRGEPPHGDIRVETLTQVRAGAWPDILEWFDNLAGLCGEDLLRVKALVRDDTGAGWAVQAVGQTFARPVRCDFAGPGHAVVIGRIQAFGAIAEVEPRGLFKRPADHGQRHEPCVHSHSSRKTSQQGQVPIDG